MKSATLLAIFNELIIPEDLFNKLEEIGFSAQAVTEEGDSLLHILAQSNIAESYAFFDYFDMLLAARVDLNSRNNQGETFLTYYLQKINKIDYEQILNKLIKCNDFDINQTFNDDETFFELIYNSYNCEDCLNDLIRDPRFNPNQKTSKYPSVLIHMASEKTYTFKESFLSLIKHPNIELNLKNKEGKTALAQLLSSNGYKDFELIKELIIDERTNINLLDAKGNNYLQLLVSHSQYQIEEIMMLLADKKIDFNHKNENDQSVLDLIIDNQAQRSAYGNRRILLSLTQLYPEFLQEKLVSGKILLIELLNDQDVLQLDLTELFEGLSDPSKNVIFKKATSNCFEHYLSGEIDEEAIVRLIRALPAGNHNLNLAYYVAIIATKGGPTAQEVMHDCCNKTNLNIDWRRVTYHIEALTTEDSDERIQALHYVIASKFKLDALDQVTLGWEESLDQNKSKDQQLRDTKKFGHLFSLPGAVPLDNHLVKLNGNACEDSAAFLIHLMNAYLLQCEKNGYDQERLDAIRNARNMLVKALRYFFSAKPYRANYPSFCLQNIDFLKSMVEESQREGVEIITGWPGHAIDLIFKGNDFYRNNTGGCSTDTTTEHYSIKKPEEISTALFEQLYKCDEEANKIFIQEKLHHLLGLNYLEGIPGQFQTVGNCSFQSLLISLKIKYRLFLPEEIAAEVYKDTIQFFEKFFIEEYLARYPHSPTTYQLLLRFIVKKLLPNNELDTIRKLLTENFTTQENQEILREELIIARWRLTVSGQSTVQFDEQMKSLSIHLDSDFSERLDLLNSVISNHFSPNQLDQLTIDPLFQGYTLLHFAVANNNYSLTAALIKKYPGTLNQYNWYNEEPLCLAHSVKMIELLVAAGADIKSTRQDNPLDHAILANRVDLVQILLKHGAKCSSYTLYNAGLTDPQIFELLMNYYPDLLDSQTHSYRLVTHAAAVSGLNKTIENAVRHGLNINSKDVNGITPLQLALQRKHNAMAKMLINFPGTLFDTPTRGDALSTMTEEEDLRQLIEQKSKERLSDQTYFQHFKENPPGKVQEDLDYLIVAIRINDVQAIRGFLLAYPELKIVNTSNLYLTSPIADAINCVVGKKDEERKQALEVLEWLFNTSEFDINARNASSEPLLFKATASGDPSILDLFLKHPMLDPNLKDNMGYTALDDAIERGHWDCAERLLADPRVEYRAIHDKKIS